MSIETSIRSKITDAISPFYFEIENESHMHSGPATDSHFKLVMVSNDFEGKRLVQRHQMIYKVLADEMQNPIHALAMHLYTEAEWQDKKGQVMASPNCMGGSKSK